jgi:AraC-like DNA-binding protein
MTISDECRQLSSRSRVIWDHLDSSDFRDDFIRIRNIIGSSNARQIIWHAVNGLMVPACPCGTPLRWHPDKHQYRDYCSKRCTAIYSQDKIRQTNLSKRGVEHHTKTREYREKVKSTSLERYGETHYSKTPEFRERTVSSNTEKFGVAYPAQDPAVRQRISDTVMSRYGVKHPMQSEAIKDKQADTVRARYGVRNVASLPAVRAKSVDTMMVKYGVSAPMQNEEIRSRAAITKKINHYTAYAYQKIHDPEWLRSQNADGKSVGEIAADLGVSSSNLCKIFHRYGLDIKRHFRSAMERDLAVYYADIGIKFESNVRCVISPYEIDIWFPDHDLGVELNGAYYHSELQGKNDRYHLNKTLKAAENGVTLLQFFDWEMFERRHLVISKINHLLGLSVRVGARTLKPSMIDSITAARFYEDNHLQGNCHGKHHIGLLDKHGKVLSAMSFGRSRFTDRYDWELLRFASRVGYSVIGAADRLMKMFINSNCNSGDMIVSYCNRRWSSGGIYAKLGFNLSHDTAPGYYYITRNGTYAGTRQQWQKHLLDDKLEKFDPILSENENMMLNGYTRVWDCGQLVFTKTII